MSFSTLQNHRPDFFMEARHLPDIVRLQYRRLIAGVICFFQEPVTEVTIEFENPQPCEECLMALKQKLLDFFAEDGEQFAKLQPALPPYLRLHVLDEDRLVIREEFDDLGNIVADYLGNCQSGQHAHLTESA